MLGLVLAKNTVRSFYVAQVYLPGCKAAAAEGSVIPRSVVCGESVV
uniref:Uncharacterized protein n=1 Tax=mine drainage metagenome TaxID=410659 RepID=E6PYX9_9ZZZZ